MKRLLIVISIILFCLLVLLVPRPEPEEISSVKVSSYPTYCFSYSWSVFFISPYEAKEYFEKLDSTFSGENESVIYPLGTWEQFKWSEYPMGWYLKVTVPIEDGYRIPEIIDKLKQLGALRGYNESSWEGVIDG